MFQVVIDFIIQTVFLFPGYLKNRNVSTAVVENAEHISILLEK